MASSCAAETAVWAPFKAAGAVKSACAVRCEADMVSTLALRGHNAGSAAATGCDAAETGRVAGCNAAVFS